MSYREKLVPYTYVSYEVPEEFAVKLLTIVWYQRPRYPRWAYDVASDEVYYLATRDNGHNFCFGPFGKILYSYCHEFLLPHSLWKRTQDVCPPSRKRSGARYVWLQCGRAINGVGKPLANVTFFEKFFCFSFDRGPVVPSPKNLVCQYVCPFMNPVDSLMYLSNYSNYFF